jgi:energy-coupling factor transporter ATP-binding protein EcfA2
VETIPEKPDQRSAALRDATKSVIIAGDGNVVTVQLPQDTPDNTQVLIDEPNPHPNPYRGLEAFREEHAPFYFGRDNVILKLQDIVYKQPLVALIGASGSGKSSLVFAGLVPQLRKSGQWVITDFRPKTQPFSNLALSLIHLLYQDKLRQAEKLTEFAEKLNSGAIGLPQIIQLILQENPDKRLLLIADQFEELYTLNQDKNLQHRFADRLLQALSESSFSLLLTMRADFMSQAIDYRPFAEALNKYHTEILAPMSEDELRKAIETPAENCGVKLESGLTDLILKDLGNEPGNLPLLEFALTQLWEKQSFRQMTCDAYSAIGGVNEALARHADAVYAEFCPEDQQRLRQIFVQLVRPGQGTEDTRQVATYEQVKEENRNLIAKLADKRLIVTGQHEESKQETIEVVHEALIRNWQPLKEWMNEYREFRVWQERLRSSIRQWHSCDRDDGALLRGVPLSEAEEKLGERKDEISAEEIAYIKAGIALRKKEKAEKERERQEREKLQKRSRNIVIAALLLLLVAAGAWLSREMVQSRKIEQSLAEARHNIGFIFHEKAKKALESHKINEARLYAFHAFENFDPKTANAEKAAAVGCGKRERKGGSDRAFGLCSECEFFPRRQDAGFGVR